MSDNNTLSYLIITPYALLKSRTGGIIGRTLSSPALRFSGIRMLAPDDRFVDEYIATVDTYDVPQARKDALARYIDHNIRPENRLGRANRVMLLLFESRNALRDLASVAGPLEYEVRGDNIRGTYGDFVTYPSGEVVYLEPAVLFPDDPSANNAHLSQIASLVERSPGVLENLVQFPDDAAPQTTLVMLKPDLFSSASARPGNIISMFSNTGLYIVGARLVHMSIAQAFEFYGFLEKVFEKKLARNVALTLAGVLEGDPPVFDFPVVPGEYQAMAKVLAKKNAHAEFVKIVQYMTGYDPDDLPEGFDASSPGRSMCLALLYQGIDAVRKIRDRLGPTDPSKAEAGTVRRDYGADLMRNGAHASDSPESASRERSIIGLSGGEPSEEASLIRKYLS
ncbi:MAG: nucleoside-diphosphate kinase [Planctomycetes bacterium]|nr:nucleoside-diphosphate kinase [Planctomycetota bacterium]